MYINQAFLSNVGVVIEFEYLSWGSYPSLVADGISVFLFDGSYGPGTFTLGGLGAGLGYAETSYPYTTSSGLTGGYIAVGLDEYGNWKTKLNSFDNTAPGGVNPNISIRGRTIDHTPYLSGILLAGQPFTLDYKANASARPSPSQYFRKVQVAILYNASISKYEVSVSIQTSTNGNMQQIIAPYTMNANPPDSLKVGLASGTGAYTSNHEIRNLRVTTPGDVRVEKTGSTNVVNGDTANYVVTIYNDSPVDLDSVTFKDILPAGFMPYVGSPVFNNGGNSGNSIISGSYTGNIYDALLHIQHNDSCTFTFSGRFNLNAQDDTTVTNTAIVKTPAGYTDTDISNDTAKATTTVLRRLVKPLALQYIACPGANVTLGVEARNGVTFYWYAAQTGGSALNSSQSTTYTVSNAAPPQTFWVEPRVGATAYERVPIDIMLSTYCGDSLPKGCAATGTLIYKEDFGGNEPSAPVVSPVDLIGGRSDLTFNGVNPGSGNYGLIKYRDYPAFLYNFDHTHLSDRTRGYFMYIDPATNQMNATLYEFDITDLCPDVLKMSFTVWMVDLQASYANPKAEMQILDKNTKEVLVSSGTFTLPRQPWPPQDINNPVIWRQYGFDFNLPTGVSDITFRLINKEANGTGNDWAMDDIEIHLCTPPVTITVPSTADTAVCRGVSVTLEGDYTDDGTFGNNLTYRWEHSLTGDVGNPAAWTTVITATGTSPLNATYSIPSVNESDTGYYRLLVGTSTAINQPNCRAASAPIRLQISSLLSRDTIIYDTICANNPYEKHGFNIPADSLQTAGTFEDRYNIPDPTGGCDSVIILKINVIPNDTHLISATICLGETYLENGFNHSESGTYEQLLQNSFGCDSLVILTLYVASQDSVLFFDTICYGDTYRQNGFNEYESGTYTKNLQNIYGCDSTVILHLTVNPMLDIEIVLANDDFCEKDIAVLQLISNGESFLWNTGDTDNQITVTESGIYTATAFINDCQKTASYTLEECPCFVFIPNAFTPNGDGLNDIFKPEISCFETLKDYKMYIYNRWGNIVFISSDYSTGWDGRNDKGKDCPSGVYYCEIEYSNLKNERVYRQTSVMVVR